MSDRAEKSAWVARVLGVQVGDSAPPVDDAFEAGDFESELQAWRQDMLQQAKRLSDAEARTRIETLGTEAASLIANGKLGAAQSLLDAMSTALAEAQRTASIRSAADESGHKVDYAKLLLRWRGAQAATKLRIQELGRQILTDPEVIADPRYEEVEEVAADLMSVMPEFGAKLEDLMDGLEKLTDPVARAEQVKQARAEVDVCQGILDDAEELAELSDFATTEYGGLDLVGELRDSLIELAGTLADA
jgi:hypothetical protein